MKVHPNAKFTPRTRLLLVRRILQENWSVEEAAHGVGVSERTCYKWLRRYKKEGKPGLKDRSSAPICIPHRTPARVEQRILKLRHTRLSAKKIARRIRRPRATVSGVLARLGLGKLKFLDRLQPVRRYEKEFPGELLHIDTKPLARITRVGHRIHGDRSKRVRGAGWEHVHVCVDDATRVAYAEVLPTSKGAEAAGFLRRALRWFVDLGVCTEKLLTDNAKSFGSEDFQRVCKNHQVDHRTTRPYRPQTNGKAERFIKTLLEEWAYKRPYSNSGRRTAALKSFLMRYNYRREHCSLDDMTPMERLGVSF